MIFGHRLTPSLNLTDPREYDLDALIGWYVLLYRYAYRDL
jgi:hypothetical protein